MAANTRSAKKGVKTAEKKKAPKPQESTTSESDDEDSAAIDLVTHGYRAPAITHAIVFAGTDRIPLPAEYDVTYHQHRLTRYHHREAMDAPTPGES